MTWAEALTLIGAVALAGGLIAAPLVVLALVVRHVLSRRKR